jgi:hypothetical protein
MYIDIESVRYYKRIDKICLQICITQKVSNHSVDTTFRNYLKTETEANLRNAVFLIKDRTMDRGYAVA